MLAISARKSARPSSFISSSALFRFLWAHGDRPLWKCRRPGPKSIFACRFRPDPNRLQHVFRCRLKNGRGLRLLDRSDSDHLGRGQEKSGMRVGQHFRRFRYLETGEEHPGECACGRCQTFDQVCEKRLYGPGHVERGAIVHTPGMETEIRINQR
jgi:hypothetical protein